MALVKSSASPFLPPKIETQIHLKDDYYALAKADYIELLHALAKANINVTPTMRESIIHDIKSHYKSIQEF